MSDNPYESPAYVHVVPGMSGPADAAAGRVGLGPFVLTILILDLVFCCLRLGMGVLGIAGYALVAQENPLRRTILFEVGTAFGMAIFGFSADTLILIKKRIGIPLAGVKVLLTVASIFVGVWQGSLMMPGDLATPQGIGFVIGAGFVVVVRLALLGLYVAALVVARKRLAYV
jgi:hypothetical protein